MTRTLRKLTTILLTMAAILLVAPQPASANHIGPFVRNWDNVTAYVLWRGHDGLQRWSGIVSGAASPRGATGINVPKGARMWYESFTTKRRYYSYCGQTYAAGGYTWQGAPFFPVTDRSIIVLDINFTDPACNPY